MRFLERLDQSTSLQWFVIILFIAAVIGMLFVAGTAENQSMETRAQQRASSQQKCAQKLLSEPITARILAELKTNSGRVSHFSTAQHGTIAGFSNNGKQIAIIRKRSCLVVVNANDRFAEILVGPVVRMPLGRH
jgi:hypothetical protein